MVVRGWCCVLVMWLTAGLPARADDLGAKQRFDAGVVASSEDRWQEAAQLFEASLAESDRPATRFNLMLAHHELKHPLEVTRHALVFLAGSASPEREEARAKAFELLQEATQLLTVLDIEALPQDAELQIDGKAPVLVAGARVYALPGVHQLQLRIGQQLSESIEISLNAGQTLPWPRLGRGGPGSEAAPPIKIAQPTALAKPSAQPNNDTSRAVMRTRAAWTLGAVGAALAVAASACLWVTEQRADELADGGIAGSQEPGYTNATDRYWNSLQAVIPLAISGGALMAGAILVGGRIMHRGSWAWSITSLVVGGAMLGAGTFLLVREPSLVVPTADDLERPSRQAGSLLLAGGLPLVTYGIAFPIARKRDAQLKIVGLSSVRIAW